MASHRRLVRGSHSPPTRFTITGTPEKILKLFKANDSGDLRYFPLFPPAVPGTPEPARGARQGKVPSQAAAFCTATAGIVIGRVC